MTTKPVATRSPANARFISEDTGGAQETLGIIRAGGPVEINQVGPGTASDINPWDAQAAVVLDVALAVENPAGLLDLTGGTASLEVSVSGQTAYGGLDNWMRVIPIIKWVSGTPPLFFSGVLGKAHVLTRAGAPGSRIRITVTGNDEVTATALVAPIVANPTCSPSP